MSWTSLAFGILFCFSGALFAAGKCHTHLKAWKRMSEEERRKIRLQPLLWNIGGMIFLCGILFVLSGVWRRFHTHLFPWTMLMWMILSGADVYWIEKSKRYIR